MTSDAPQLAVRSDPDVQVTIYDAGGLKRLVGAQQVAAAMPRGLYRVHLDRCGFSCEHLIHHDSPEDRAFAGPLVESPAPIEIARDSAGHAQLARQLSTKDMDLPQLGSDNRNARLFVFVRRVNRGTFIATVPSEPISIHDLTGRRLVTLAPDNAEHSEDPETGYLALSCRVGQGTYRLRVGRQRDLAVTIPAERAGHVFLADHGTISLRTARVYLPRVDEAFDPCGDIARAMESVLWALGQPRGDLPLSARELMRVVDRDPSFGIACAHLAWRHEDRATFNEIMRVLIEHAPELPDVAILERTWENPRRPTLPSSGFAIPPLFRASLELAFEEHVSIASQSALVRAAKAGHDDSVWCTWSPRWLDEQWIEPTIERLRHDRPPLDVEAIAHATWLPTEIVALAIANLDAGWPRVDGMPISLEQLSVPGYTLGDIVGRGSRSTVFRARRDEDAREVAVKVIPISGRHMSERIARELEAAEPLAHRHLVQLHRCGVLPQGSGVWLEMELCSESLFARLAAIGRPIPFGEACDLVLQALEALTYMHDLGIVHGHINPGNLLVRADGTVALGFPGFARCQADAEAAIATDGDSDAVPFMAPEVALDTRSVSAASDVWSMAATLYFLLTLELPRDRYADQSEREAAQNELIPIAHHLPGLPDLLTACLARALSPQTDARFRDGKELHDALLEAVLPNATAIRASRLHHELVRKDPAYASTIRNIFLRMSLLTSGGIVRRRTAREELTYRDPAENRRVDDVLQRFNEAGLITLGVEDTGDGRTSAFAELAHDELVHGWTQIRKWLDELDTVPEARGLLVALAEAVRSWQAGKRARSLLWNDRRVKLAGVLRRGRRFVYNAIEEDFVRRSRRRRRIWYVGLSASLSTVVAAAVVVTGCVYWQQHEVATAAVTARTEAQQTLARSLQETGREYVLDGRPFRALPYLVAAGRSAEVGPPLRMLFRAAIRGLPLAPPLEHQDSVKYAAFSPDGSRVVTASTDGTARVWDASTGAQIAVLDHKHAVVSAAFSPDGKSIITASEDWTAQLWSSVSTRGGRGDAASWRRVLAPFQHADFVQSAVFSSDGKHVVTASLDHTARIWDVKTGALEHKLEHRDAVWSAAFSADGTRVVTASRDRTARIWEVATGKAVVPPLEHRDAVWSAAFSPDGTRVVTASQDRTARIWDAATGKAITPALEHRDGVTSATFDAHGKYVVTASYDNTARVWNALTGEPVTPPLEHRGSVMSAAFSPDGARIVTASSDETARLWDARTGRVIPPLIEHTGPVTSAVFNADGTRVVTASFDKTAHVWNAIGDKLPVLLAFDGDVRYAGFSPDGRRMVTASDDKIARIWDTATGALLSSPLVHQAVVRTAAFSPDGKWIVTTSDGRTARIWDATTGRMLDSLLDHSGRVTSATFSPDGTRVVTTSVDDTSRWDDTLRIWDATTGKRIPLSLEYPDRIVSAWLNRDGTRLVTLSQDRTARVWNAATGKAVTVRLDQIAVTSVAFSPDGTRVVTASEDKTARVWDAATGRLVVPPLEHEERVICASFSPDGGRIVTASADRTARVWDAITGKPLTPRLFHDAPIVNAAFSADGARIVTVDSHAVRTWDVSLDPRSPEDWSKVAEGSPYVLKDGVLMLRSLALTIGIAGPRRAGIPSS